MVRFDEATHTYQINGEAAPSVTQILSDMGFIDTTFFTEYGRLRGAFVHRIIHWHLAGELDEATVDPALRGYFDAWKRFESDTGFVSTETERPLGSEIWRFAGTPDHIGYFGARDGRDIIIDVKSGAVFPATQLQLAAYEILHGHTLKRFALCLKDDGKYSLKEFKDRQDKQIFLAALACWWWQKNNNLRGRTV